MFVYLMGIQSDKVVFEWKGSLHVRRIKKEFVDQVVECSPMARETKIQSQVEAHQRLKNGT